MSKLPKLKPDIEAHRRMLEAMGVDPDSLPKPVEPEYMSWPLEKLQSEYFRTRLELSSLRIQKIEVDHRNDKVEAFVTALKDLLDEEAD